VIWKQIEVIQFTTKGIDGVPGSFVILKMTLLPNLSNLLPINLNSVLLFCRSPIFQCHLKQPARCSKFLYSSNLGKQQIPLSTTYWYTSFGTIIKTNSWFNANGANIIPYVHQISIFIAPVCFSKELDNFVQFRFGPPNRLNLLVHKKKFLFLSKHYNFSANFDSPFKFKYS